jgi:acetyltransferase-like isoleucine patch superfamily enzyme
MLAGLPFRPFDQDLLGERRKCTQVTYYFNNMANAQNELSEKVRRGHFSAIVAARWLPDHVERPAIFPGHFGEGSHVATPFYCDYGYHLSIGPDVVIESDCHFHDSARIHIGRNTKIGASVTIQTLKTPTDKLSLKGGNGTEVAQEVSIGQNVYIGDRCVIEAGVKIGDNTIVRPGSVVSRVSTLISDSSSLSNLSQDIPNNCVAQGNPAIILPN